MRSRISLRWVLARFAIVVLATLLACIASDRVRAQDEESEDQATEYLAGLVAEYSTDGSTFRRVEPVVSVNSETVASDPRLAGKGPLKTRWVGHLFVRYDGQYAIRPFGCGEVTITLDSNQIVTGKSSTTKWFDSATVDLEYGWHPIEIVYSSLNANRQFGVYWSSDQFEVEPITSWFHRPGQTVREAYALGRRQTRLLGCANCHEIAGASSSLETPALDRLAGNLNAAWLVEYLVSNTHGKSTRAPDVEVDRSQAESIASFLLQTNEPIANDESAKHGKVESGRELFNTVGCLACHAVDGIGAADQYGGGDLSSVASKRTRSFFARWLTDPAKINRLHRMPVFDLNANDCADVSAYLSTLKNDHQSEPFRAGSVDDGMTVLGEKNCLAVTFCRILFRVATDRFELD